MQDVLLPDDTQTELDWIYEDFLANMTVPYNGANPPLDYCAGRFIKEITAEYDSERERGRSKMEAREIVVEHLRQALSALHELLIEPKTIKEFPTRNAWPIDDERWQG